MISGAKGAARLREVIDKTDTVVLLKAYRQADDILAALEELGLTDRAICISRVGLEGETVVQDVRALAGQPLPYFSMIIIRKEGRGLY